MKIRNGFVSNSSSSSFILKGYRIESNELNKYAIPFNEKDKIYAFWHGYNEDNDGGILWELTPLYLKIIEKLYNDLDFSEMDFYVQTASNSEYKLKVNGGNSLLDNLETFLKYSWKHE